MTIEEAKAKFGHDNFEGFVFCRDCPLNVHGIACDPSASGYDDCWEKIAKCMTAKETEEIHDAVNCPSHYTQGDIECIDAMESAFGADELAVYCKIAAFKYIWRCGHKNGLEDVKKAVWYLNKLIELKEGGTDDPMPANPATP